MQVHTASHRTLYVDNFVNGNDDNVRNWILCTQYTAYVIIIVMTLQPGVKKKYIYYSRDA